MKILFLMIVSVFFSLNSYGNALITIQGKLTSIAESQYVVETPQSVYYIRRSMVSSVEAERIQKTGVPVSLTVPFEAIDVVKTKSASNTVKPSGKASLTE